MHHNLISQLLGQGKQYSYFTSNFPIMSRVLHFMNSHFKKNDLKQEHLFYGDQDRRGFVKKHSIAAGGIVGGSLKDGGLNKNK